MSHATQGLEIPQTLLGPNKTFSEELAAEEISKHAAAYDEAHLLHGAFTRSGKRQAWVPLPGTRQEVCLEENKTWDGKREFLHLFGVLRPEDKDPATTGSAIHLVTFSQVQQLAGVHYVTAPGVTLDEEISDSRQVALSSGTKEFQFVVNTLEVMHVAAAELGLLAVREAQSA